MYFYATYDIMVSLGDLNVRIYNMNSTKTNTLSNFTNAFGMIQLINRPGRITNDSYTLIGLLFYSNINNNVVSGTRTVHISDQMLIFVQLGFKSYYVTPLKISYRPWRDIDPIIFQRDLESCTWNLFYETENIDDQPIFEKFW